MAEVLGNSIKNKLREGVWKRITIHPEMANLTHSQFADDTLLLGVVSIREVEAIKETLEEYARESGQHMNKEKSQIFFLNTSRQNQNSILQILGFPKGEFPLKYLGISIGTKAFQKQLWEEVVIKCKGKVDLWKNKWLSQAGRIQMIKFVLSAIPIYSMSCFKMIRQAYSSVDGLLKKFLWEGSKEVRRILLINWDTACLIKEEGAARLRKMEL
ncbi:uncharacterized protein LOC131858319 [Cryptomeria japonica]|uniref:uncharacterized protein LOC131858319 n=1 Tax=Cryptomeria japonica TaxID=3369 RepID=UPI0027DA54A1|nr:uncharacterized protein LOC131858319 [Cryptomeria japonica]